MILLGHQKRLEFGCTGRLKIEKEFDEKLVINAYLDILPKLKLFGCNRSPAPR